jgi:hypothetical protein
MHFMSFFYISNVRLFKITFERANVTNKTEKKPGKKSGALRWITSHWGCAPSQQEASPKVGVFVFLQG